MYRIYNCTSSYNWLNLTTPLPFLFLSPFSPNLFFSFIVFGGTEVPIVYILLCHPSEDSLQWITILDGTPSLDWQSTVGWVDCWIWTQDCSFTIWWRYQWTTIAPNEPPLLTLSHHCSRWATTAPNEPPLLPVSHHCSNLFLFHLNTLLTGDGGSWICCSPLNPLFPRLHLFVLPYLLKYSTVTLYKITCILLFVLSYS